MQPAIAIRELNKLLESLERLPPDANSPEITEWRTRLDTVITASLGKDSLITKEFEYLRFRTGSRFRDPSGNRSTELSALWRAQFLFTLKIHKAIAELETR